MAKSTNPRLGPLLRKARTEAGYTQRDVERETSVSNAYLSQLESGKVREPSPTILHKLAELYTLDYADLLAAAGYPLPAKLTKKKAALRSSNRLGPMTDKEESALEDYLAFLRSKERQG